MKSPGESVRNTYRRQGARRILDWIGEQMDEGKAVTIVKSSDGRYFLINPGKPPVQIDLQGVYND